MKRLMLFILLTAPALAQTRTAHVFHGKVTQVNAEARQLTVTNEPIEGWMGAMTMEFPVKPDADFQKLHVGDRIEATVVVFEDLRYHVTDVKITRAAPRQ